MEGEERIIEIHRPVMATAAAVGDAIITADDDDDNNNKNLEYARRLLYISHFTSQFAEWAWQFSLVIWLAALSDYSSLFLVSIYQATAQLLVLSLVPTLSKMIDSTTSSSTTTTSTAATTTTRNRKQQWNRSQFATYLIAAQNACVFIATMTIGFTMKRHRQLVQSDNDEDDHDDTTTTTITTTAASFSMVLIAVICCFGGMAQVLDRTVLVAIERDWIVVMAEAKKINRQDEKQEEESSSSWLQDTNVTLKQMDLSCQVLGPSFSGLVLANSAGFGWVGGCTLVSLITEVSCMKQIYQLVPSLQQQQQNGAGRHHQQQHQRHQYTTTTTTTTSTTNKNNDSQEKSMMALLGEKETAAGSNSLYFQQEERDPIQNASQELLAPDDKPNHQQEKTSENNNNIRRCFSFNNQTNVCFFDNIRNHHQLHVYASQTMAWAGLGLALLYFNVLTFSGMMTAYLVSCGMSKFTIGIWRGIS
eukprot:scaffold3428_cov76-Cylindrotheca_fusiformis.AAC.2